MLRTIVVGVVALAAVVAVLGMVFAVGALRIRMADEDSSAAGAMTAPDPPVASQPSATPELPPQDAPPEGIPAIDFQTVELPAERAKLSPGLTLAAEKLMPAARGRGGKGRKLRAGAPEPLPEPLHAITGWHSTEDNAEWIVTLPKQGLYEVEIVCASASEGASGFGFTVTLGDQELSARAEPASRRNTSYKMLTAGTASLPLGEIHVRFQPSTAPPGLNFRLRSIRLIPAS